MPGESLGERGILKRENRSLTANAQTDCHLLTMAARDFRQVMKQPVKDKILAHVNFVKQYINF